MSDEVLRNLAALNITLPTPPRPLGAYQAVVEAGSMLYVSMQGPIVEGRPKMTGLLGRELTVDDGRSAATFSIINSLAQIHFHLGGFDRIRTIVRLDGYVACVEEFTSHPLVIDAASELLAAVFKERSGHTRTLCGVRNLPGNLPVGIALMAELKPSL